MTHRISAARIVSFLALVLLCCAALGCPSDEEKSSSDGGDGAKAGTEANGDKDSGATASDDASTANDTDSSTSSGDAGEKPGDKDSGESTGGGEISGPASFHAEFSGAKSSNAALDDVDSMTPSGASAKNEGVPGTSLSASAPLKSGKGTSGFTIFLNGHLTVGATFEMVLEPSSAYEGYGYVNFLQSSYDGGVMNNTWRAESGTFTVEAVKGTSVKISSHDLKMTPAINNAPGNTATGTFDATIEAQVLDISGL